MNWIENKSNGQRRGKRVVKPITYWKIVTSGSAALASVVGLLSQAHRANAANTTYTWDTTGANPGSSSAYGGAGAWNTTTDNWWTSSSVVWGNATTAGAGNNAAFGGGNDTAAGGIITINGYTSPEIGVGNITFNTSGYNIAATNGGWLYLAGTASATASLITTNASATISAPMLTATTNGAAFSGTAQLSIGAGALQDFYGSIAVNSSANVLLAGSNNTMSFTFNGNVATTPVILGNLALNGTLNLNGNSQVFGNLSGTTTSSILTDTSAGGSTVVFSNNSATAQSYSGSITGNISLEFIGGKYANTPILPGTMTLLNANSYTGTTIFSTGTVDLGGTAGQLAGTSAITGYAGTLLFDNTLGNLTNRVTSTVPITLNSSTLTLQGNASSISSAQNLGTVTANSGLNTFNVVPGTSSGVATLTIGNLANNFGGSYSFTSGTNALGGSTAAGFSGTAVALVNNVNGGTNILTNGIIGGYAVVISGTNGSTITATNNVSFATYITPGSGTPGGVIAMGTATSSTIPGYTAINAYSTHTASTALSTDNLYLHAPSFTSTTTINSLNSTGGSIGITSGKTLTIGSGGLIFESAAINIGSAGGFLTAGTSSNAAQLDIWIEETSNNTNTLVSSIVNNTNGGSVSLVLNNGHLNLSATNSFSGSTIINGGILEANSANTGVVPGPLVINNSGFFQVNTNNQTSSNTTTVTINNGGQFYYAASAITETIAGLNINNNGGISTGNSYNGYPGFYANSGAGDIIKLNGNVAVVNNSLTSIPQISANATANYFTLDLGGANRTFNISGTAPVGLSIGANNTCLITDGGIIKTGSGILVLAGNGDGNANTFSYLDIQGGAVDLQQANLLPTVAASGNGTAVTSVDTGGALLWDANISTPIVGQISLNGGSLGRVLPNGSAINGFATVNVTSNGGSILLHDFLNPGIGQSAPTVGFLSGGTSAGTLSLIGPTVQNMQTFTLMSATNSFNGGISIGSSATLISAPGQGTGSTFGTNNTITMAGNSGINIQDNAGSGTGSANTLLSGYNQNYIVNGPSTMTFGNYFGTGTNSGNSAGSNTTGNILPMNNVTLNNNTSLTVNSGVLYVASIGGTLSGGGTIGGTGYVTVTGTVAPGDAPAILNINSVVATAVGTNTVNVNGFSLTSSSTYAPEINRTLGAGWQGSSTTNAGISYDQINMTSGFGLAINGATLNVRMSGTSSLTTGDEFFLVNEFVASTGTFNATVDFNGTPETSIGVGPDGGLEYNDPTNANIVYELDYTGNITTGSLTTGDDVVLDVIATAPVPEPASLSLIGIGAMGLLTRRRRQKSKQAPK